MSVNGKNTKMSLGEYQIKLHRGCKSVVGKIKQIMDGEATEVKKKEK